MSVTLYDNIDCIKKFTLTYRNTIIYQILPKSMLRSVLYNQEQLEHQFNRNIDTVQIRIESRKAFFNKRRVNYGRMMQPMENSTLNIVNPEYAEAVSQIRREEFTDQQIYQLIKESFEGTDVLTKLHGIIGIHNLVNKRDKIPEELISCKYFLILGLLLQEQQRQLVFEATWLLSTLSSHFCKEKAGLCDSNVILSIIYILAKSTDYHIDIINNLYLTIGNIIMDDFELGHEFIKLNGIDLIVNENKERCEVYVKQYNSQQYKESIALNLIWLFGNFCRGPYRANYEDIEKPLLFLASCFSEQHVENMDALADIMYSLEHNISPKNNNTNLLFSGKIVQTILAWLDTDIINIPLRGVMLRVLGIAPTLTNEYIERLLKYNPLPTLLNQLDFEGSPKVRTEAAWIFSNMFATNRELCTEILEYPNLHKMIIKHFTQDEPNIKKQLSYVIANISLLYDSGCDYLEYIESVKAYGIWNELLETGSTGIQLGVMNVMHIICSYLRKADDGCDLEIFQYNLERCGIQYQMFELQYSEYEKLANKTIYLLDKYFVANQQTTNGSILAEIPRGL